jgi:hypothetical protein
MTQSAFSPQNVASPAELLQAGAASGNRVIYFYAIPAELAKEKNIREVGLVELTADEELMCTKRANNNPIRLAYELAKESLRQIDKVTLSTADGSADVAWNKMGSKIRTLVVTAYNKLHNPTETEGDGFLKSQKVTVG